MEKESKRPPTLRTKFERFVFSKVDQSIFSCKKETIRYIINLTLTCLEDEMKHRPESIATRDEFLKGIIEPKGKRGRWNSKWVNVRRRLAARFGMSAPTSGAKSKTKSVTNVKDVRHEAHSEQSVIRLVSETGRISQDKILEVNEGPKTSADSLL